MNPALPGNERGKWASALLAIFVHVALGLFLFYGVRWQNRLPDPVEVELVSPPPPSAEPQLSSTRTGGTPYGASHVAGGEDDPQPSDEEAALARALGRRVADIARRLEVC